MYVSEEEYSHLKRDKTILIVVIALLLIALLFIIIPSVKAQSNADMERVVKEAIREQSELTRQEIANAKEEILSGSSNKETEIWDKLLLTVSSFLCALFIFGLIQFRVWIKQRKLEQKLKEVNQGGDSQKQVS